MRTVFSKVLAVALLAVTLGGCATYVYTPRPVGWRYYHHNYYRHW
jgi:hypothetical protein